MTLQDSIAATIRNWPTLYGCRSDVLQHYFCAANNGLDWQDGILVDRYGDSTEAERASMRLDAAERLAALQDELQDPPSPPPSAARRRLHTTLAAVVQIATLRHNAEVQFRTDHADVLALVPWGDADSADRLLGGVSTAPPISMLAPTCALFSVPDDVQPDWLEGAREMIFTLFRTPTVATTVIDLADTALQRLATRFPPALGLPCSRAAWQAMRHADVHALLRRIDRII